MGKKGPPTAGRDVQVAVVMWAVPPPPPPPPQLWMPWLIPLFALANTAAFAYSLYINDCPSSTSHPPSDCLFPTLRRFSFEPLYVNFLLGPSPSTLDKLGALDYYKVVVNKEKWRLMTCIWLHAGLIVMAGERAKAPSNLERFLNQSHMPGRILDKSTGSLHADSAADEAGYPVMERRSKRKKLANKRWGEFISG